MRTRLSIGNIASATSTIFYEVGNSLNLSFAGKTSKSTHIRIITDDNEALKQDWNQVGKEVMLASDRFEKQYSISRDSSNRICTTRS